MMKTGRNDEDLYIHNIKNGKEKKGIIRARHGGRYRMDEYEKKELLTKLTLSIEWQSNPYLHDQ